MQGSHFWVVGGDRRLGYLARLLAEDGHQVHTYALEQAQELGSTVLPAESLSKIGKADCVILPLPVSTYSVVSPAAISSSLAYPAMKTASLSCAAACTASTQLSSNIASIVDNSRFFIKRPPC